MKLRRFSPLIAGATALGGCNLVTGVGDLQVEKTGAGGQGAASATSSGHASGSGAGAGASSGTGGTSTTSSGGGAGATTSSGGPTCAPACAAHEYCEAATKTCVCDPGYVQQAGACSPAPAGDPSTHTQADVCDHWTKGHLTVEPSPPLTATGAACDPGTLSQGGIVDTLTRLNMFRWMAGLGPTSDDPMLDADAQQCANLEAWWDFSSPQSPHMPPTTTKCYNAAGASAAGQSNIAWGSGNPPNAVDQWVEDNGNETTLGHRRWILNPPLDPVGIGYWETGGSYGNAACLRVFGASGTGPSPAWVSMPTPGFVPIEVTQWTWSFHGSLGGIPGAKITMLRVDDNTPLAVTVQTLSQGYAQDAVSWTPSGWQTQAGKTYRVTVSGLSGGDVTYDVKPVACP